ncbi:MAG: hypothetical protein C0407_14795 [Desulfobacca sp.]|nr:hypothetical protein [Desulfobacca sp.]
MIFITKTNKIFTGPVLLLLLLLLFWLPAQPTATDSIANEQLIRIQGTPYPYPQPYPPGYHSPRPETYEGTRQVRPSGWISIEIDPPDAAVFIDGNKLEQGKDNTYEEGVFTGRHKIEVKKRGFQDHMEWIEVQTGATENRKILLKQIK